MSAAAVASSDYQKTGNMVECAEDVGFPSLATPLVNLPLCLLCAFTSSALTKVWSGTGTSTVLQQMSEIPRCSQALSAQGPPGFDILSTRLSVLINTADEGSFASSFTPAPFAHPSHPAHSLSSNLQQIHFQTLDHQNMSKRDKSLDVTSNPSNGL